jgi:hypothetical protein
MNRFDDELMKFANKIFKAGSFKPILKQNVGTFHSSSLTRIPRDNGFHQFFVLKLGGIPFLLCRKMPRI